MIVWKDVSKTLGDKQVIKDCTFHISLGECVGLIGKNGAGKTTLLNLVSGILLPDSGFIRVGYEKKVLQSKETLKKISYVSGSGSQLWQDLKIKDSFANALQMYGGTKSRMQGLVSLCDAEDLLNRYPADLSLGEKMRCEIIYALLTEAPLLLLDEVMIGLDAYAKQKILECLESLREEKGYTILYTSHNLTEVERLCKRVILIDEGRILYDGSLDRLMHEYALQSRMHVTFQEEWIPDFEDMPIKKYVKDGMKMTVFFNGQELEKAELIRFITTRSCVKDMCLKEPDLEQAVLKIYGQTGEDK